MIRGHPPLLPDNTDPAGIRSLLPGNPDPQGIRNPLTHIRKRAAEGMPSLAEQLLAQ